MLPRKELNTFLTQEELIEGLMTEKVDYIVMSRGNFNLFYVSLSSCCPLLRIQ